MIDLAAQRIRNCTPERVVEVELSEPLPVLANGSAPSGQPYGQARVLVRLHGEPLGLVRVALPAQPGEYALQIWSEVEARANRHRALDGLAPITTLPATGLPDPQTPLCRRARLEFLARAPMATVVVCTRERPQLLTRCLRSVLTQAYPRYEVIVVDNAPRTVATAEVVRDLTDPRVRYTCEPRPGLSWARNCGVSAACGDVVAFVDDDMVADRGWLAELLQGFEAADDVAAVGGLILPLELDTPAQLLFEEFGSYANGFDPLCHSRRQPLKQPLYPYTALRYGAGGNIAYRADVLRELGGFSPALGAGTPARSGEDIAFYLKAHTAGYALAYRPNALAYHQHRRETAALSNQVSAYAIGFAAFVTHIVVSDPRHLWRLVRQWPRAVSALIGRDARERRGRPAGYPLALTWRERLGWLWGPVAYTASRLRAAWLAYQYGRQSPGAGPVASDPAHREGAEFMRAADHETRVREIA